MWSLKGAVEEEDKTFVATHATDERPMVANVRDTLC